MDEHALALDSYFPLIFVVDVVMSHGLRDQRRSSVLVALFSSSLFSFAGVWGAELVKIQEMEKRSLLARKTIIVSNALEWAV